MPSNKRAYGEKFSLNRRIDGRLEVVCEHGVGHTVSAPKEMGERGFVHGCDGCCGTDVFKEYAAGLKVRRPS